MRTLLSCFAARFADLARSLKAAVNHFLRLGLMVSGKPDRKQFLVHPRALGLPPGLNYDNVEDLIEAIEGTTHK